MQPHPITAQSAQTSLVSHPAFVRWGASALFTLSAFACEDASQTSATPSSESQSAQTKSAAPASVAPMLGGPSAVSTTAMTAALGSTSKVSKAEPTHREDTFDVYVPKSGAGDQLTVQSKAGYKINENYPHRAIFTLGDKTLKAQVSTKQKTLGFSIPDADLTAAGTNVKASFSVCDDKSCKMYSKTYSW